jgi:hypothetical protein
MGNAYMHIYGLGRGLWSGLHLRDDLAKFFGHYFDVGQEIGGRLNGPPWPRSGVVDESDGDTTRSVRETRAHEQKITHVLLLVKNLSLWLSLRVMVTDRM